MRRTSFTVRTAGPLQNHAPMQDNSASGQAVGFLLGLIGSDDAEAVR
ncbi:hypothetical protein AB0D57_01785 [Streptomyces sp. NPDC048275]